MSIPIRKVYATYLNADGSPKHGYVEFSLTTEVSVSNTAIIPVSVIRADLNANGRIDADLIVTDDTAVKPPGLVWSVEEKIENGNLWYVAIPKGDGSPIDLTTLFTPGLRPPVYPITGPPGPPGPPGVGVPVGGIAGQILSKRTNGDFDTEWKTLTGGGGVEGTDYYIHTQAIPSTDWVIEHNLSRKPSLESRDSIDNVITGSIQHQSDNITYVHFQFPITGTAYCV